MAYLKFMWQQRLNVWIHKHRFQPLEASKSIKPKLEESQTSKQNSNKKAQYEVPNIQSIIVYIERIANSIDQTSTCTSKLTRALAKCEIDHELKFKEIGTRANRE